MNNRNETAKGAEAATGPNCSGGSKGVTNITNIIYNFNLNSPSGAAPAVEVGSGAQNGF